MKGASVLALEGRGDAVLAFEDGSQAGPAGAFSLLAEASADCLHHLVGDHVMNRWPSERPWVRWKMGRRPSSDLSERNTDSTSVSEV